MPKIELYLDEIGKRLDATIADKLPELSRTKIQKLIEQGKVAVNGKTVTSSSIKVSEVCTVILENDSQEPEYEITPENIALDVVFEDEFVIILNKPAGMVCHPAPGHKSGTLVNALTHHFQSDLSSMGGVTRPGIVHRLDKDTSGLMLIAKTDEAHMAFANLFANEKGNLIKRKYICFVYGVPTPRNGQIETFITRHPKNRQMYIAHESSGKNAITLYNVQKSIYFTATKAISKVNCELLTGRTHQIRVHMKYIGNNIIGDAVYGKSKIENTYPEIVRGFPRQALHSQSLEFKHPFTKSWMTFKADLPADIALLDELFNQ